MRRFVIGLACATAIGVVACQVQGSCETTPAFVEYCGDADPNCQGHIWSDGIHWESGPQDGNFLPFGAAQVYHLHYRDAQTKQVLSGQLADLMIQVGATQKPNVGGSSWIQCADGLCNVTSLDPTSLYVQNGTCSPYFFRVVVTLAPTTSTDAGTD